MALTLSIVFELEIAIRVDPIDVIFNPWMLPFTLQTTFVNDQAHPIDGPSPVPILIFEGPSSISFL